MYPHRINLRDPWQRRPGAEQTFARAFNWPNPLMPFEELWLVVGTVFAPFQVRLNQQVLGQQETSRVPLEFPVSQLLRSQNLLEIECLGPPRYDSVRNVYLEVRRTVHFRQLIGSVIWQNEQAQLQLRALLNGQPDRPLSIVIRLNHVEVHYQELGLANQAINVITPPLSVQPWQAGQANDLYELEVQLLDPACSLSQHHFVMGFAPPAMEGNYETFPDDESYLDSTLLEQADRAGRLVMIEDYDKLLPYVWHHASVRPLSVPGAASLREDLRCS